MAKKKLKLGKLKAEISELFAFLYHRGENGHQFGAFFLEGVCDGRLNPAILPQLT
jgi:hypothetical protein